MSSENPFTDGPVLSAELQYFHVPRDDWELMLARMRQLGANTIAACVPWSWHAPRCGTFDFDGSTHPQRDLVGFVGLCGRLGLRVLLKPGPHVGAVLLGGVPAWLLYVYPEIQALSPDGQPWRHPADDSPRPSPLHPRYLEEARRWIAAFSAAMLAFQRPVGPVVAVQLDIGLDDRPPTTDDPEGEGERGRGGEGDKLQSPISNLQSPPTAEDRGLKIEDSNLAAQEKLSSILYPLSSDQESSILHPPSSILSNVMGWLREDGWTVPLGHVLSGTPRDAAQGVVDVAWLGRAAGWVGYNAYARDDAEVEQRFYADCWRTRLLGRLNPEYPPLITINSATRDAVFAAPLLGGAAALNVSAGPPARPAHPAVAVPPGRTVDSLIQPDGSVRPRFWNARLFFSLLGAAGADFASARAPAALALGYAPSAEQVDRSSAQAIKGDHAARSQALAERLMRAGVAFDVLDLDAATPDELERYALVVVPAAAALASATQQKLARCPNLALVGDEERGRRGEGERGRGGDGERHLSPPLPLSPSQLRLPEDVSGAQLAGLVEERSATARYAWADGAEVDVSVRYGARYTYLFIANRCPAQYSGTLTYRDPDGAVQHLQVAIGAGRVGAVMLRDDDVVGAALGGDGAEGGWLVRGRRSSMVFGNGAGVVAPCGDGLLLSAPQSGRFQVRRPSGWDHLVAYRLLLSGQLLPASFQVEAAHLSVPYVAEDARGQTDLYAVLPKATVPPSLREYLSTLLNARAAALRRAAALAATEQPDAGVGMAAQALDASRSAAHTFAAVARELETLAAADYALDAYSATWRLADDVCRPAVAALTLALARVRVEYLAEVLDAAAYEPLERRISQILGIVSRGG